MNFNLATVLVCFFLPTIYCTAKDDFITRLVGPIGITFYSKPEILKICDCIETKVFKDPSNNDLLMSSAKSCGMSNSLNKGLPAVTLFGKLNSCLSAGKVSLDDIIDRVMLAGNDLVTDLVSQATTRLTKCKKACDAPNSAGCQNSCVEKVYVLLNNKVTRVFVDDLCQAVVKKALSKLEYGCLLAVAPQVMKTDKYQCAKIQLS